MKKAVFFTLGLTMLAFVVLSLSFIFAENSERYDIRFMELASIGRIYDLDASLQSSFSRLFAEKSGMTYTASNTESIFQNKLPLDFNNLDNEYTKFQKYATAIDRNVNVTSLSRNVSLKVSDMGLIYWQDITKNISYFTPTTKMPSSYAFILDFFEVNITSCNSSSSASGNFSFYVAASGGNSSICNVTLLINPLQQASIGIGLESKSLTVQFSNYVASVEALGNNVSLTSRAKYTDIGIKPTIELDSKINVTIPNLIARIYGNIRIA